MVAALDVDYEEDVAYVAAVVFGGWADSVVIAEKVVAVTGADSYQPRQFSRRELPGLLAVLREGPPVQATHDCWKVKLSLSGVVSGVFDIGHANEANPSCP